MEYFKISVIPNPFRLFHINHALRFANVFYHIIALFFNIVLYLIICFLFFLTIRRAVVLIQVAPLRVAKDYGTSSLKHKPESGQISTERSEVSR